MAKGFNSRSIPDWTLDGIEAAFDEWMELSGEWLQTAPEYLLTVKVAQKLREEIPAAKRTLLMEPHVGTTLAKAGGIQRGPNAEKLRSNGRFDIVLGHGDGRPRMLIELKNPHWTPMGEVALKDLHRICRALLQGKNKTQLYGGVFAFYTSSGVPLKKDPTARERLQRKWVDKWEPALKDWEWAKSSAKRYRSHLTISVQARIHEVPMDGEQHAWAAVGVSIFRKPRKKAAKV